MSMPKAASKLRLDFSSLLGPLFYCWVVQLLLPTMLQQLVYEKEKRLRMMMKMHGLGDVAYWVVTYLWFLLLYIVYIAIFIIVGAGAIPVHCAAMVATCSQTLCAYCHPVFAAINRNLSTSKHASSTNHSSCDQPC